MLLKEKVIAVTGGAGLLGEAFVKAIAAEGGVAVIASRNLEAAEQCAAVWNDEGAPGRIESLELDITDPASAAALFSTLKERHGRVDALVNNAFPRNERFGADFLEVRMEDFAENVNDHLGGYFLMCQAAVRFFLAQGAGNIVNLGSIYGVHPPRFELYAGTPMTKEVEYVTAKAGVVALTEYVAKYCKGKNIRANTLSPGGIFDGQPEAFLKRYNALCLDKGMLAGEDVAGALVFLLSDQSRHVNGQNIVVDDGFTIA